MGGGVYYCFLQRSRGGALGSHYFRSTSGNPCVVIKLTVVPKEKRVDKLHKKEKRRKRKNEQQQKKVKKKKKKDFEGGEWLRSKTAES